jgi:hypothetical protein
VICFLDDAHFNEIQIYNIESKVVSKTSNEALSMRIWPSGLCLLLFLETALVEYKTTLFDLRTLSTVYDMTRHDVIGRSDGLTCLPAEILYSYGTNVFLLRRRIFR